MSQWPQKLIMNDITSNVSVNRFPKANSWRGIKFFAYRAIPSRNSGTPILSHVSRFYFLWIYFKNDDERQDLWSFSAYILRCRRKHPPPPRESRVSMAGNTSILLLAFLRNWSESLKREWLKRYSFMMGKSPGRTPFSTRGQAGAKTYGEHFCCIESFLVSHISHISIFIIFWYSLYLYHSIFLIIIMFYEFMFPFCPAGPVPIYIHFLFRPFRAMAAPGQRHSRRDNRELQRAQPRA